jgi:Ulp1 family protease
LYDRIETIDSGILNEYQKYIAKQEGTTKQILCVHNFFFNNLFREEVDEVAKRQFLG